MATPTAIAIRQETAAARIQAAAAALGVTAAPVSRARDAETRIAEILETTAGLVEAIAAQYQTAPAADEPETAAPARRSKSK